MAFNIDTYKENINNLQRASLFEVIFANAKDKDKLRFRINAVKLKKNNKGTSVKIKILEDEEGMVAANLLSLNGLVEIIAYRTIGDVGTTVRGNFKLWSATTELDWNASNEIQLWTIKGTIT